MEDIEVIELSSLGTQIELLATQTCAYKFQITDNSRKLFTVVDLDITKQDLCLSVWFSSRPFYPGIKYDNFLTHLSVEIRKPLTVAVQDDEFIGETNKSIISHTITREPGYYYVNVQNRSGSKKKFSMSMIQNP